MNQLICYKTMPQWNANSLPAAFRKRHNTKIGTWAKLTIIKGELDYYQLDENDNIIRQFTFSPEHQAPFIEPQEWHRVQPKTDDLLCQLSFYCQPQDYYQKKYRLSAVHSEVIEIIDHIQSGDALDLGCGQGRNALFLQQQGFNTTAFDANSDAIDRLNQIIEAEQLTNIKTYTADANQANIDQTYDLIISTVVLMFLDQKRQPAIIDNLKNQTKTGGYNLIVCALDSPDYPCSQHQLPFNAPLQPGQLKNHYADWNIKKYNENIGHLHRTDAQGNPIALRFATLIAQKP